MHHESHSSIIALLKKQTAVIQAKHKRKAKRNNGGTTSKIDKTPSNARKATTLPKHEEAELNATQAILENKAG